MRHFTFCQPHFCSLTNYFVKGANNVALASLSVRCAISFVRKWFQPFFGLPWSPNASDPRRIGSQSERIIFRVRRKANAICPSPEMISWCTSLGLCQVLLSFHKFPLIGNLSINRKCCSELSPSGASDDGLNWWF